MELTPQSVQSKSCPPQTIENGNHAPWFLAKLLLLTLMTGTASAQILLTEIVVTPTAGEFIEIHNPGGAPVDLSDVYLTDATFAGGGAYYYNIVTGADYGGGGFSDFHARFPDGAMIAAGEFQTIAIAGSTDFFNTYGSNPTYELYEDDGAPDGIPDMREAVTGSVNNQGGLTNGGEVVILYFWDGLTDLVQDLDYVVWGDKDEAVDKTGVAIDGPDLNPAASSGTDGDPFESTYLPDTAIPSQEPVDTGAHPGGVSWTRTDLTEGTETMSGGNGISGDDETSENLASTWSELEPNPGTNGPVAVLVINEIIQNPDAVGDGSGEWFEIYNPGSADVDIEGWTIADDGSDSHVINAGGPLLVPADGYLVLGNNIDTGSNGGADVDYDYGSNWFLANSADEVVLFDGDMNEIDRVNYDGGPDFPDPTGASMSLIDPALDNNVGENWCEATTPFGDGDFGTPGAANDCESEPADVVLVINEIIQNPDAVSDGNGEWIELFNPGVDPVDIDGFTIEDNGSDSHLINNGGPLVVPAGGYLVIGRNADSGANGGVTVAYQYSDFFLANGDDEVVLLDGAQNEIDRVEYDGGPGFPDPTGASMSLILPSLDNNVAENWCEASTPFGGGDFGTPGAANDCTPPLIEIVINEIIQNPAAVGDNSGEWVELYNPTDAAIDINGWVISDNDSDSHTINNGGPLQVPSMGYLVLGNNTDSGTNGGATVAYSYGGSFFLANGGDELVLSDGSMNEIDRVEWDNGATFPDPNGASMSLIGPGLDNNVGTNWCEASTPFGDGDLGTPGSANVCPEQALSLYINEVMQNPAAVGDDSGEWIEIHNPSAAVIDISGWTISDNDSDSHTIAARGVGVLVPASGYLLLGNNTDSGTNGGAPVDYDYGGSFFLSNGADELVLTNSSDEEIDRIEWDGGPIWPDPTGASMALRDPDINHNSGINWCTSITPFGDGDLGTPGAANDCEPLPPPEVGVCADPATLISSIQGSGSTSPFESAGVTVEAVVVGDYQETFTTNPARPELQGFFLQEEDADNDADIATSEGLFVFDPDKTLEVAEGDVVRVAGFISEAFGNTQMDNIVGVVICSNGNSVTPAAIDLPAPADFNAYYEQFEGMLTEFVDVMTVTDVFPVARFGQVVLSEGGRLRQYGQDGALPLNQTDFDASQDSHARRSIILDDFNTQQNIDPVYYPQPGGFAVDNFINSGATVTGLQGVLEVRFGTWTWQPQTTAQISFVNPIRPAAPMVPANVKVAALNVLNFFNGDGVGGGFPTSRGADSAAELQRQTDKLVAAITGLDADVLGLMEIENDGDAATDALAELSAAVNAVAGAGTYDYVRAGANGGTDEIKVSLIYKPGVLTPVGAAQSLNDAAFTDPNNLGGQRNRPALAQTFQVTDPGNNDIDEAFTVVVLHLKSKGAGCGAGDDSPIEGNCNDTRLKAATALLNWLDTDPTDTEGNLGRLDSDVLIIGDINSYYQEGPLPILYSAGYVNQLPQSGYSFTFGGQLGSLDHILASADMDQQVLGAAVWHINSDESALLDYNDTILDPGEQTFEAKPPSNPLYDDGPYRASDHDPLMVGLNLISPPIVETTDPVDGEVGVAHGTDITVTFNKPVDLTEAAFAISCTESGMHGFLLSGGPESWVLNPDNDFLLTETCTVTVDSSLVDDVADGTPMEEDYLFSFSTSNMSQATILVSKDFNDGNPAGVGITLNCFSGLPISQEQEIWEGQDVEFTVQSFQPGSLNCNVVEETVEGYVASYDNGFELSDEACVFNGIQTTTVQSCVVSNALQPVDIHVTKEWILPDSGPVIPLEADATYQCFNVAQLDLDQCSGASAGTCGLNPDTLEFSGMTDTQSFPVYPNWNGTTSCSVTEGFIGDGVEKDDSDCQNIAVDVGQDGAACTITNLHFFEGIPTLSRLNLMLMALMMLGIGMFGFRRIIA